MKNTYLRVIDVAEFESEIIFLFWRTHEPVYGIFCKKFEKFFKNFKKFIIFLKIVKTNNYLKKYYFTSFTTLKIILSD